jgi:XTP/dITP diphosphohydrolase
MAQPALPLIEKLLYRASKYGVDVELPATVDLNVIADETAVGQAFLAVIAWAHANGVDAESALRKQALALSQQIAATEAR